MQRRRGRIIIALTLMLLFACPLASRAADAKLTKAIAVLRHIDQHSLTQEQKSKLNSEINQAWAVLKGNRTAAVKALEAEFRTIQERGEKDDYFLLNASRLLWEMGGLDYTDLILRLWRAADLTEQYGYVFSTALQAALTHDERAVPLLREVMCDRQGHFYVGLHSLDIKWPLSIQFIWGVYGPKGLPVLLDIVRSSIQPNEVRAAIIVLSGMCCPEALPLIRARAVGDESEITATALESLGAYGHPVDYDLLISGVASGDVEHLVAYVRALTRFEDLRCVEQVAPLLRSGDEEVAAAAYECLTSLVCPESLAAIQLFSERGGALATKLRAKDFLTAVFTRLGYTSDSWSKLNRSQQEQVIQDKLYAGYLRSFRLAPGEKPLTRGQALEAIAEYKKAGRLETERYGWVEPKHLLPTLQPQDLPLLYEVSAGFYSRVSDEGLYDLEQWESMIRWLVRSGYRTEPWVTTGASMPGN